MRCVKLGGRLSDLFVELVGVLIRVDVGHVRGYGIRRTVCEPGLMTVIEGVDILGAVKILAKNSIFMASASGCLRAGSLA